MLHQIIIVGELGELFALRAVESLAFHSIYSIDRCVCIYFQPVTQQQPSLVLYVQIPFFTCVLSCCPYGLLLPIFAFYLFFRRRLLIWRAWAFGWHLEDWIRSLHAHVRFADAIYAVHHSSDEGEKVESLADYSAVLRWMYSLHFVFWPMLSYVLHI